MSRKVLFAFFAFFALPLMAVQCAGAEPGTPAVPTLAVQPIPAPRPTYPEYVPQGITAEQYAALQATCPPLLFHSLANAKDGFVIQCSGQNPALNALFMSIPVFATTAVAYPASAVFIAEGVVAGVAVVPPAGVIIPGAVAVTVTVLTTAMAEQVNNPDQMIIQGVGYQYAPTAEMIWAGMAESAGEAEIRRLVMARAQQLAASGMAVHSLVAEYGVIDPTLQQFEQTVLAAVAAGIPALPELDLGADDFKHAAESRGSLLRAFLAYEAILHGADGLFCSTHGRCIVTTVDPYVGLIGAIFSNEGSLTQPSFGKLVTVIFSTKGSFKLEQVRLSSCAAFVFWYVGLVPPNAPGYYQQQYDSPPAGNGRCVTNGNQETASAP